ncbi:hypothetical protein [Wolbachia endosymbiont of Frankliniella intonsa]|uniref:hypothetical protein n=1 Tax=Wolbachia endosymbiont of Frankliniella intonsa TaxID=2902422 RepID=UPI00244ED6C3|nr:hypothetical protein [Wolbachia endosymbiont of Frankliniella intonsa]WGJ62086.1 hypothetical protein M3L71_07750 [Wolbachia endosymbiont of Frankliniella intonsa]
MKQELIISYTEKMDVLQEERKFMQMFQENSRENQYSSRVDWNEIYCTNDFQRWV